MKPATVWHELPTNEQRWAAFRDMIAAELPEPVRDGPHPSRYRERASAEEIRLGKNRRERLYRQRKRERHSASSAGRNA